MRAHTEGLRFRSLLFPSNGSGGICGSSAWNDDPSSGAKTSSRMSCRPRRFELSLTCNIILAAQASYGPDSHR